MKVLGLAFAILLLTLLVLLSVAAYALDAGIPVTEEYGLLAGSFLGFASLIVAAKLIPGIIRFAAIIREEEVKSTEETTPATGESSA
ncbi:hypothetical protein [Geobacter pickeringii]|uniref:Uncharacterized protein n=1 Tax=Geobacter pickeringii TaxID=345632 RepID=A0A0B5B7C1_9BACT|nr:hypothetical protein [Geobacter pickeringii]AJE02452.1 hypothetical protein GPICK_02810 [Geobacter pickeringii]